MVNRYFYIICCCLFSISLSTAQIVTFKVNDIIYSGDNELQVDVSVTDFEDIACFQFPTVWDPDVLVLDSVGNFNLPGLDVLSFGLSNVDQGSIRCLWIDYSSIGLDLPNETVIYSFFFSSPCGSLSGQTDIDILLFNPIDNFMAEACTVSSPFVPQVEGGTLTYFCELYTTVYFPVFNDLNGNSLLDIGEPLFPDVGVLIEPNNLMAFSNNNDGGLVYLPEGDYNISYNSQLTPNWELTSPNPSYEVSMDIDNLTETLYFGIHPLSDISETKPYLYSGVIRCQEWTAFKVMAKNEGTMATEGTLWLEVDEAALGVTFADPPDVTFFPNLYGWHFDELYPGHSILKTLSIHIPGPPDFPIGDIITFESYVEYSDSNGSYNSDPLNYHKEVQCSYDPNDKQVSPNRPDHYTLFNESMVYTIRFQNTGNAVAYDVVIKDTLDEALDPATFTFLSSSHSEVLTTTLLDGKYLTFNFNNIFLPDSTANFDESQGYVSFSIHSKTGLPENTLVTNRAGIYFDANPPVLTNMTENILVLELPVSVKDLKEPEIMIYPNPTSGFFEVVLGEGISGQILVEDCMGNVIVKENFQKHSQIDLSPYPSGIYLVLIQEENYIWVERLIKM